MRGSIGVNPNPELDRQRAPATCPDASGSSQASKLKNPILLALRLSRRRRLRQFFAQPAQAGLLLALVAALAASIGFALWHPMTTHGRWLLIALGAHVPILTMSAGLLGWWTLRRSRYRGNREFALSWLVTAPVAVRDLLHALRYRVGREVAIPLVLLLALPALLGIASATFAGAVLAGCAAGYAGGALAAWCFAKPMREPARSNPRLRRSRVSRSSAASLAALARWPFAQTRAAAAPRGEAPLFAALLLMMPSGIPPLIALLLLAFAVNALFAISLLHAQLETLKVAANWLRTTPLGAAAFARAMYSRSGIAQLICGAIAGVLAFALGAFARPSIMVAAGWLAVTTVVLALGWARTSSKAGSA